MFAHEHEAAGWFLEHAWLIPVIPAVAFAIIIVLRQEAAP